jgi:hypothetical protein
MTHPIRSVCCSVRRALPVSLLLMSFIGCPHAFAAPAPDAAMVARLGPTEFKVGDFADFLRLLDPAVRKQAMADPQAMSRLIGLELARIAILKEAKAKNWPQRPDIARQIERARDDVIVNGYLASVSVLPNAFPSTAEVQSAYDLNRDSFMVPRQYQLAQIFIASPKGADKKAEEAAKKKADELSRQAKLLSGKFEDIARASSEHKVSASKGGDMGWAAPEQIVPEIRAQIIGMSVGEVSAPIRSAAGWHIVRLMATKPAAPRPIAEVKDTIVATLRQRKSKDIQQDYVAKVLEKNPIAVNEAGLRKLFETAPPPDPARN